MKLATLAIDGWELESGEAIHREKPHTFELPPLHERSNLQNGAIVKLIFHFRIVDASGQESLEIERMWVIVHGRVGEFYRGILDNDPDCTDEIKAGLEVWFRPEHVIQIWREQ
jgi:hypothetical protein